MTFFCGRPRPPVPHCTRFFIHIRSSTPANAPLYSLFHTHLLVHSRQRPVVLAFSYTFARPLPPTPRCTRFFIHICSSTPDNAPLYSLFHTHLLVHSRQRPVVLAFSYTFARPRLPAPRCTRFFIHIRSPPSASAPLYSLFHTHSLVHSRQRPVVLAFSYTFARPRLPAPRWTRFFIHIRSSTPASAPLYSLFHTHLLVHSRQHPVVLAFSYTFARPRLPAPHCTRFFIHICSSTPVIISLKIT